jgi:ATP-dependent helicase YprA (DUF1998 family)
VTSSAFSTLPIRADILSNITSLGFESMTPVQQQSLPILFSGQDLLGQAKTGSGKTAAFAIGIINKLETARRQIRAGDILGALTANTELPGKLIGKIDILNKVAYVAVERKVARQALKILLDGKIKGRKIRVRKLDNQTGSGHSV